MPLFLHEPTVNDTNVSLSKPCTEVGHAECRQTRSGSAAGSPMLQEQ